MAGTYTTPTPCECLICGDRFDYMKKLANHLKSKHKTKSMDYTIEYLYGGVRPSCPVCQVETRYQGFVFKRFCKNHSSIAESEAGRVGGKIKTTWSKGFTKDTHPILARFSRDQSGEGNHFFGKHHASKAIQQISDQKRLSFDEVVTRVAFHAPDAIVMTQPKEYLDRQATMIELQCNVCNDRDQVSLFNIERSWRCRTCHPVGSKPQIEIGRWIQNTFDIDVSFSDRSVIKPLELDIWIPTHNIAIEYHGLYWHSGGCNEIYDKTRHSTKQKRCVESNIRLIQLFSDEWRDKRSVCESVIRNALGRNTYRLNARDCTLVELETVEAKMFLEMTHISGYTRSSHKLGLKHPEHGLVAIATLRKPLQKKHGNVLELARMAFKPDFTVRGGASKLLSHAMKIAASASFDGMLSYADLRLGEGNVYAKCGFERKSNTGLSYFYTDGTDRFDRFMFRAQEGMTEKEYAASKGVRPVWTAGNAVYVKKV